MARVLTPTRLGEQAAYEAVKRELATSPQEFFTQRLELIEAGLNELVEEAGNHYTELVGKIELVSGTAVRQAEVMAAKIVEIQKATQELQIMVYGEPRYQLDGLASEVKQLLVSLETMQVERQSLRWLVKILAAGVALTFVAVLIGIFLN